MVDEFRPGTFITLSRSWAKYMLVRYITHKKTIVYHSGEVFNLGWLLEKGQYNYSTLKEIAEFKKFMRKKQPELYNKYLQPQKYNE